MFTQIVVLAFALAIADRASAEAIATKSAATAPEGRDTLGITSRPSATPEEHPRPVKRFTARFSPDSLIAFLETNPDLLPLPLRSRAEKDATIAALRKLDMGALLEEEAEQLKAILGDRLDMDRGLIVEPTPPDHQVAIDTADLPDKSYRGPKRQVVGLLVSGISEDEYVAMAVYLMEKGRQLLESGEAVYDRTHPDHDRAVAKREADRLQVTHNLDAKSAKEKEDSRKRVGELLGVYDPATGEHGGKAKWVKESRRLSYIINPKTGEFIDRLQPIVDRINREMELAGYPGPTPSDIPGIHFDPSLGDVEIVLPKQMMDMFLEEADSLEQRMAEKLIIGIEAVRLTDRDIVNGAVAARINADLLGVTNARYGFSTDGAFRRVGIDTLLAVANQQLQIQQLNSVAAGSWPTGTPLVTIPSIQLPPLQESKTWTSVGGRFSIGSDPIFFDGREQTFGLTYVDPNGVSHNISLDVVDSLRNYWNRIERNLIVHKIKKDPDIPPTKFTVPVGPSTNTFEGLAALISQEDQNLIVATGTGAISQISAKAGTWLVIQDFRITPVPGSSTALTEAELDEIRLKTLLTMFLRDPNTSSEQKRGFLESQTMGTLQRLLVEHIDEQRNHQIRRGLRAGTYGELYDQRFRESVEAAAIKKKEQNSVITLTFYSSQGNIVQTPGTTQLGASNDLTSLTTELRPNDVTPISSFVLKTVENAESKSPLTGLSKGESSDESKTMAHLLVRTRFPTPERMRRDLDEARQLGYFRLPIEREPLTAVNVPFLSSSDHPLERLATFRVGAMFDSLQADKIRRFFSPFQPNVLRGTITEGTWKLATLRLMVNRKIIADSPANKATLAPLYRERFITEVRSLLEYDPDFFDEPNIALRNMHQWNDPDRIQVALNSSPGGFARERLDKMIDELGSILVPDSYANAYLARAEYRILEGHRLRYLSDDELQSVRRDVASHFLRLMETYGDAFLEAVSSIFSLESYRSTNESDFRSAPLDGYRNLVLFDRSDSKESDSEIRTTSHGQFMQLKNGGFRGRLFERSLLTIEDLGAKQRRFIVRGEDIIR